jgi:phosphatidylcholine synthase
MKTKDKSFAGFPACWNMVVLVLFATKPGEGVILAVVILLTLAMFTNLKFIHPTRTQRWHRLSLAVCTAWIVLAGWAAWLDFQEGPVAKWLLVLTSLYLVLAGIAQQVVPQRIRRVN